MTDFAKSREIAFRELSEFETIRKCSKIPIPNKPFLVEAWEVEREIEIRGSITDITFIVCFLEDFPFSIPKIYLPKKDLDLIGYIPHLGCDGFICTYHPDTVVLDYTRPEVIVHDCIQRASMNIKDGINGKNKDDFNDEYLAYWKQAYLEEQEPIENCLNLIESEISTICFAKLGSFKCQIGEYKRCLYLEDNVFNKVKENLNFLGNDIVEINEVLLFPDIPNKLDTPPFKMTYGETSAIISSTGDGANKIFIKYINKWHNYPLILFRKQINNINYFVGWTYEGEFIRKVNGFREGKYLPSDQLKMLKRDLLVRRISIDNFSGERFMKRTAGDDVYERKTFTIAGLGSLGSNLCFFLNSYHPKEFRLIDMDTLEIENTYRHLFGISYSGFYKTDAIKSYLIGKNPKQSILTKNVSIIKIIENEPKFINETDFLFVTIGNGNVERYISMSLTNGNLTAPTFIIWVEPYLVGGHCLFYPNSESCNYESLFEDIFYKYNVIDKEEYLAQNKNLTLREAGCQATYVPYGGSSVILFLSALFPKIDNILKNGSTKAIGFTWFGSNEILENKGIKQSVFANELGESGKIIQYEI